MWMWDGETSFSLWFFFEFPPFSSKYTQWCKIMDNNLNFVRERHGDGGGKHAWLGNKKCDIYHGLPAPEIYSNGCVGVRPWPWAWDVAFCGNFLHRHFEKKNSSCQHVALFSMISPIKVQTLFINHPQVEGLTAPYTGFTFRFEHRKWNRGRNGLHQLGQPVAPSVLFPVLHPL